MPSPLSYTDPDIPDDQEDPLGGLDLTGMNLNLPLEGGNSALSQQQRDYGNKLLSGGLEGIPKYEQAAQDALANKKAAIERGLAVLTGQKPDRTALLLGLSSGFLKPTRTGSFFESLGNAGENAQGPLAQERALAEAHRKEQMSSELGIADVDSEGAKLNLDSSLKRATLGRGLLQDAGKGDQARALMMLRSKMAGKGVIKTVPEGDELVTYQFGPGNTKVELSRGKRPKTGSDGEGRSPAGKQAFDEGLVPGTPEYAARVTEIGKQDNDLNAERLTKEQDARFLAKRTADVPKVKGQLQQLDRNTEKVNGFADEAIELSKDWSTTGLTGELMSRLPTATEASALRASLASLKANIGFDTLSDMRANNTHGAGLGSITDMENQLLQVVDGSMDPTKLKPEKLQSNLKDIKTLYAKILKARHDNYNEFYGPLEGRAKPGSGAAPTGERAPLSSFNKPAGE